MIRYILACVGAVALAVAGTGPASASQLVYVGTMSGANEAAPNTSPATGTARLTIDDVLMTMRVEFTFSGLLGTDTAAHIHCCTAQPNLGSAGVATVTPTFTGMTLGDNLGVSSGSFDFLFDMTQASSWSAIFLGASPRFGDTGLAFAALLSGIQSGQAYLDIHSTQYTGGEIRTFFTGPPAPTSVPEPRTLALMLASLVGIAVVRRRRTPNVHFVGANPISL
jgi:hypothetical protein